MNKYIIKDTLHITPEFIKTEFAKRMTRKAHNEKQTQMKRNTTQKAHTNALVNTSIDWCLALTLTIFQLYRANSYYTLVTGSMDSLLQKKKKEFIYQIRYSGTRNLVLMESPSHKLLYS